MSTIKLYGFDALNTCIAAKRMPEIMNVEANLWRPARSYPEARRLISTEPQLVRLVCDARVLLEDLSSQAIQFDDDLVAAAEGLPSTVPAPVKEAVINALKE